MDDQMKGRSGFTGVPLVVNGFAAATEMYNKQKFLKAMLQRNSEEASVNIEAVVASKLREQSIQDFGKDTCAISPTIGNRKWFKRQSDGALFQCVASTWGRAAIYCDATREDDIINMTDDKGWVSSTHGHSYVRIPEIAKEFRT